MLLFKTRTHPGALHGPIRKKLHCVKVGFTYLKIVPKSSGAGDEDYFNKELIDYEAELGVPFTLRHCCEVLRHSSKWRDQKVSKFSTKKASKRSKTPGSSSFNTKGGDASINLNVDARDDDEDDVQVLP
nr:hypothetical protein [Tanacetum cinerariifolium]